eukprot:TRINITY_DN673_c0_g1_i8.p1 TRINITY_DN673_c0_g1~~TRINITY_DN673_c0_g1_i8.p1  ORF type:complete len:117 (+),score=26.87 TRINITY_DN673_c0_g1_i8:77-427(+)
MCIRDRYIAVQWISHASTFFVSYNTVGTVYKSPLYYACVVLCALLTFTIDHFIQIWEFHIVQNTSNFCRLWSVTYDPGDYEGNSYKMQMLKIIDLKHRDQPLPALSTPQGSMQLSR